MAFAFDTSRGLQDNLRRVAKAQLSKAESRLSDPGDDVESAIHDARKRMKKLRGLLRLVRPGLGDTYDTENAALRDAARGLAPVRDAQVMVKTVGALSELAEEQEGAPELLTDLQDWAASRRDAVLSDEGLKDRMTETVAALAGIRNRGDHWSLDRKPAKILKGGLKKTYGRARKRFEEADEASEGALLHDLRKRVKYHSYHCRLLMPAWPEAMQARKETASALAEDLGDDHDLAVLAATLKSEGEEAGIEPAALRLAEGLIRTRSALLRQEALARGPQLFADSPKDLAQRLSRSWALASPG